MRRQKYNSKQGKTLANLIRKETYGKVEREYLREQYIKEAFANKRDPNNLRSTFKNQSIQCLNLSAKDKGFNLNQYLENINVASYKLFALIIQDLTGKKFIYEEEYNQLKPIYDKVKAGVNLVYSFRHIYLLEEELFRIIETYEIFTMDQFENFEKHSKELLKDVKISEEMFNEIKDYYSDQISKIKQCSEIVEHPQYGPRKIYHKVENYDSYNKLIEKINYIEENFVEQTSEQSL